MAKRHLIDIERAPNGAVRGEVIPDIIGAPARFEGWHELLALLGDLAIDGAHSGQGRTDLTALPAAED